MEREVALFPIAKGLKARIIVIGEGIIGVGAIEKLIKCLEETKGDFSGDVEAKCK